MMLAFLPCYLYVQVVLSGYRMRSYEYYYGGHLLKLTMVYNLLWLRGVIIILK